LGENVAARTGQLVLKALEGGGGLEQLAAAHQAVAAFHGNNYLPLLEGFYRSHRAVLFTLVDALELEATSAERGVLDALEFIRAMRHRRGEWIEQTCLVPRDGEQARISAGIDAFASDMWKRTLRDRRRPGCWRGVTWRCACSPTWPPNCAAGTSPWSARTPTPTCTTR